jgi:N-acetylglucosamine-6-phosphate deacetylase
LSQTKAYIADRIFTGSEWLTEHAVISCETIIQDIVPASHLSSNIPVQKVEGSFICPAFIDVQLYGAYGKLFAEYPDVDCLEAIKKYCEQGGAAFFMPTVATNTKEVFFKCIDAVKKYWQNNGKGVLGLHFEGPWINPAKRGAHIEALVHPPSLDEVKQLLNYGRGIIKMITLAPEICSPQIIDCILSYNIVIAAGHSNATYDKAIESFENGITTVTHLYNAMSPLQHRQPGLVGAAFEHAHVMASIIPDGHHVSYTAIRIAKKIMQERLFAITDAVTETTSGPYQHSLQGDKYEASGILSGSALTMAKAMQNLIDHAGVELEEAIRMCSLYPAKVLRMENSLGKIQKGYTTPLLTITQDLRKFILLK